MTHAETADQNARLGDGQCSACGRMIAFVLAFDEAAAEHVADAVAAATAAKTAGVFVLASPQIENRVAQSVYSTRRKGGGTIVQVFGFDPGAVSDTKSERIGLELPGLPQSLIPTIHAVAESVLEDYEAAIVMDAATEQVAADQLQGMCLNLQTHPDSGNAGIWIQQFHRPPYLIPRSLLEQLQ